MCAALFGLRGVAVAGGTSRAAAAFFVVADDGGLMGLTGGFLTKGTVLKLCSALADVDGVADRAGKELK